MNGTLEIYGFPIEWEADANEDDGFYWRMERPTENGQPISMEDWGDLTTTYHADIDQAVKTAFYEACAEHNELMQEYAA